MQQRLQKIISSMGKASRREAERMINMGRITVNGITARLGQKADPDTDNIELDGNPLVAYDRRVYIMLNKPRGYVTTMKDERGRKTVRDLVAGFESRIYPVGRLDMASEGLLLMTNDGELSNRLMHPRYHVPKGYLVKVRGGDIENAVKKLSGPMELDGIKLKPARVRLNKKEDNTALLSIVIFEGKNRQIRRMCHMAGLDVISLKRVSQGRLRLGNLKPGTWRYLTKKEIEYLLDMCKTELNMKD